MFVELSGLIKLDKFGEFAKIAQAYKAVQELPPVLVPSLVKSDASLALVTMTKKRKEYVADQLAKAKQQVVKNKAVMDQLIYPSLVHSKYTPSQNVKDQYYDLLRQEQDIENQQSLLQEYKVSEDEGAGMRGTPILRWQDQ